MAKTQKKKNGNGGNLGFEEKLWQAADKMRGHMDPSEYKHVLLGLVFLKYISDAFEERRQQLEASIADEEGADYLADDADRFSMVEDRDEYLAENVFWVPREARWRHIQDQAKQPSIGKIIDNAMVAVEKENSRLKGVLPKDYARPSLDKHTLGELVDLVGTIGLGDSVNRSHDVLGRVYEYFLGRFASAEGKGGGEFYTPQSVVKILVEMIEPYTGRVYDPCCGSGGMFVQSEKFVEAHGGRRGDIAIYGQESNPTTWRLCKMNLAIRGIDGNIGPHNADSFRQDLHKDMRADFVLANPPFNDEDWGFSKVKSDARWAFGAPPAGGRRKQKDGSYIHVDGGNANYAWIQHFIHHLAPSGIAAFVLANGSMSSNTANEGVIRKNIIEADLVDCMIALPGQLFYSTPIPACLWFIARNKNHGKFRDRRGEALFIDARKMGVMVDRRHRELTDEEIAIIANIYHAWRGEPEAGEYTDIAGFCKSAPLDEIKRHGYGLTPGSYVGTEAAVDDGEPFDQKMKRLSVQLEEQFAESARLETEIRRNLKELRYGE